MAKSTIDQVLKNLHSKFETNIGLSLDDHIDLIKEAESKSKALYFLGNILKKDDKTSSTQKEIVKIFDEIFVDLTTALYLSSCALDNSGRAILRRVLELGLSIPYLWDQPVKFWSWYNYDENSSDLSFKDMLEYIGSRGYVDHMKFENHSTQTNQIKKDSINKIYRDLSNVIHGRSISFESKDPDSFKYKKEDLTVMLNHMIKTQNIVLSIFKEKFPSQYQQLESKVTSLTRYNYDY